jgi:outer membrane protein assembly factor BamB
MRILEKALLRQHLWMEKSISQVLKEIWVIFIFFSEQGRLEKKIPYGEEISASSGYPGTRSTPTIADNLVYIATGHGKLVCLDLNTEKEKWSKNLFNDFDGKNIRWSLTENLVVDGDVIYVAPGGKKNNVIALNRHNGSLIWSSEGKNEISAYCSPLLIDHNGRKIFVTMMEKIFLDLMPAVVPCFGRILTRINIIFIPIHLSIMITVSIFFSGYGKGGIKVNLNADGSK